MDSNKEKVVSQFDAAWQEILRKYFKDFTELCWPDLFSKIDWNKGYKMLERELNPLASKKAIGKRIPDKLIEVCLNDGTEVIAIIHLEVQAGQVANFAERVFIYRYRVFDIYKKDVATMAILIDGNPNWRPGLFEREFFGSKERLEYPILKILDFKDEKQSLESSENPFALIILAQLVAIETSGKAEARLISKYHLTKWLYLHGLKKEDVFSLLRFVDEILALPDNLGLKYRQQVSELEQELQVSYMTTSEKNWLNEGMQKGRVQGMEQGFEKGIAQGIEQGIEQGKQVGEINVLIKLLKARFHEVPEQYLIKLQNADLATLEKWVLNVLNAKELDEVFKMQ